MVWNWLHCWMPVISATDLDSVADHGFDHKRVLKVTDAVALLCLPSLDAWNREGHACRLLRRGFWRVFKPRICTGRSGRVISEANQEQMRH